MISAGRLSKLVTFKEAGEFVTKLISQDGPIAFIETTTQTKIFGEDANRCLLFSVDEGPEQTKAIIDCLAARKRCEYAR